MRSRSLPWALGLLALSCARAPHSSTSGAAPLEASAFTSANPFAQSSSLQYQAPQFNRIRNPDYQSAIEEGMRRQLREVDSIARQTSEPTFDNTIVALERTGVLLTRSLKVFGGVVNANTNDTLQRIQTTEAPKLAAHTDAIYLNPKLFQRVESVYDRRAGLNLTPEQMALLGRYHRDFVRAGAQLSPADKSKLSALNQEEAKLSTSFQNQLLAATKAAALVIDDPAQLQGLSKDDLAAAAEAAKERGMPGKYVIVLQNTTQHPLQASLANRAVRQRLFEASTRRADRGDSNDTRAIIRRLAVLRAQRAGLLGFPDYAAFALANQMARTPEAAIGLLGQLVPPATRKARAEAEKMQAIIDRENGNFKLAAWDWQYYAERVRQAEYNLDEAKIKPYFLLDRVLQDGVFFAANRLYGLTFKERKDLPVYHPDVHVYEVFDTDGKSMALFYTDYFKRDNKGGGAWMDSFVDPSGLMGTKPVVYNVCNFTKPAPGMPALLTFDDVTTMFHEFGHALHGMFANVQYPTLLNVPRDFVEFPSQFNEHWALDPAVFANYARHYQTGQAMPQDLVDRIKKARTFNQGFATTEYLAAALLDLAWHSIPQDTAEPDVEQFEQQALARFHVNLPEVPPRYRTPYFAHIWGGGYSASYYAYLWSELLDDDAYAWFTENGGMTRANGQRYRDMILSRGSTEDAGKLFRAFRGRDPKIEPLLDQRGLEETPDEK
ncbi:MAG TPA: M3 family metallopeptidase [Gemmatimonadales bacterium]|nr:M3 family metallopeptidase [Gemmatimonadales bacterium]